LSKTILLWSGGRVGKKRNSKNKNQNFEEIILSRKSFFAW
jgi:hypothetical protein